MFINCSLTICQWLQARGGKSKSDQWNRRPERRSYSLPRTTSQQMTRGQDFILVLQPIQEDRNNQIYSQSKGCKEHQYVSLRSVCLCVCVCVSTPPSNVPVKSNLHTTGRALYPWQQLPDETVVKAVMEAAIQSLLPPSGLTVYYNNKAQTRTKETCTLD